MSRKILIGAVVVTIVGFWLYFTDLSIRPRSRQYQIEGKTYRLIEARTPQEWETGLMGYRSLTKADGMIFLFPEYAYREFWNKNTYLDLTVVWMDGERVVGKSVLPSIEKSKGIIRVRSPSPVNRVVEIVQ